MKKLMTISVAALFILSLAGSARAAEPLAPVAKYKMPSDVKGRFDHLGVDLRGNRLFLAAETAHEVLVFNLRTGRYIRAITGIGIPHAILCRQDLNRIYITDGGAGELKIYDGKSYRLLKSVKLKVDADSIGYDSVTHDLYIDDGGGDAHETFSMFSVVNTTTGDKVADTQIDGDTLEAMALEKSSPRIYVNNRAKNEISVIDRATHKLLASWPVTLGKFNVAMALDEASHRLFIGCRGGQIVVFDTRTGKELQALPIPKGIDDLVFDSAHKRIYAACGSDKGAIAVYQEMDADHYKSLGEVPSAPGGKNEVLVPQLGRLYITIPPQATAAGEVYVYKLQ
ncbi:MAG TPA: YncE family protein [Candidatus Acidoferrales bacterium]|nr:YncE family protein [Candidatus Acidoferrales bacterium]